MEMEFLSALNYKTCVYENHFFSWAAQCQYWMTQLTTRPVMITAPLVRSNKRANYSKRNHPYYHPRHQVPMLSWSSSVTPSYNHAASVATVAAATAMNVNFIPRVSPQQ